MKFAPVLLSAALAFGVAAPASAQVLFDQASVTTACSAGGPSCTAYINGIIAQLQALGLSPAAINSQLASLASATLNVARTNPAASAGVALALQDIANASTDAGQKATILAAADTVAQGNAATVSPTETFSASNA